MSPALTLHTHLGLVHLLGEAALNTFPNTPPLNFYGLGSPVLLYIGWFAGFLPTCSKALSMVSALFSNGKFFLKGPDSNFFFGFLGHRDSVNFSDLPCSMKLAITIHKLTSVTIFQ